MSWLNSLSSFNDETGAEARRVDVGDEESSSIACAPARLCWLSCP
eukprot:SAG11_NODE_21926_length_415_cov_11.110759_1_plen_44_part_01